MSGSALILNDYFDLEVDKINAPNRPLPSGILSSRDAIVLTIIATFLGIATSASINPSSLFICIFLWIIGALYNSKLKETGILGNIMVSLSVATTFILGGFIVENPWDKIILTFSIMSFLIDLGEEIAGDAMDIVGDKKRNSKSIAIKMGLKTALRVSFTIFILFIIISMVPFYFRWLGISYMIPILISDIIILFSAIKLLKSSTSKDGHTHIKRIYRGALLGLLAFMLGQFF